MKKVTLGIDYINQNFNPERWNEDGFASREKSLQWSDNSCGVACLLMIIRYFGRDGSTTLHDLLRRGINEGAFSPRGWIHAKLAEIAESYGLQAAAVDIGADLDRICRYIDEDTAVIASVTHGFPCDGRKGGHLVVVDGYSQHGESLHELHFLDPSSWGRTHRSVAPSAFLCSFTGRIIAVGGRVPRGQRRVEPEPAGPKSADARGSDTSSG